MPEQVAAPNHLAARGAAQVVDERVTARRSKASLPQRPPK